MRELEHSNGDIIIPKLITSVTDIEIYRAFALRRLNIRIFEIKLESIWKQS